MIYRVMPYPATFSVTPNLDFKVKELL